MTLDDDVALKLAILLLLAEAERPLSLPEIEDLCQRLEEPILDVPPDSSSHFLLCA